MTQRPCDNCLLYLEAVINFLKGMSPVMGVLSGIMFIAHPAQAARAKRTQKRFACDTSIDYVDEVLKILESWSCPGQVVQLSVNQADGPHRRFWGPPNGYSLLSTFGAYKNGSLSVPVLGFFGQHNPGTVSILAAGVLKHEILPVHGDIYGVGVFESRRTLQTQDVDVHPIPSREALLEWGVERVPRPFTGDSYWQSSAVTSLYGPDPTRQTL